MSPIKNITADLQLFQSTNFNDLFQSTNSNDLFQSTNFNDLFNNKLILMQNRYVYQSVRDIGVGVAVNI